MKLPESAAAEKSSTDRRAILEILSDVGGRYHDERIANLLNSLGVIIARDEVVGHLQWMNDQHLAFCEKLGHLWVVQVLPAGRDVAAGRKIVDGVSPFKFFE